jgi:hypothetical protein
MMLYKRQKLLLDLVHAAGGEGVLNCYLADIML